MKISVTTYGTAGEILPLLELARALHQRGHAVRLAMPPTTMHYAAGAAFAVLPCSPDITPEFVRANAAGFSLADRTAIQLPPTAARSLDRRFQELTAACWGANALVAAWFPTISALLRETLGIPWIQAQPTAGTLWYQSHEREFAILESGNAESLDPWHGFFFRHWRELRQSLGLKPLKSLQGYFRPDVLLAGVSPRLFPLPAPPTKPEPLFTGFWQRHHSNWQPDPELQTFLTRRPAVFSFSSQPLTDPQQVLNLHARGCQKAGLPLLVLAGWSGLTGNDLAPDIPRTEVLIRPFEPFQEVAKLCACAIVHGGIGTIADALHAACPLLVEPHGGDQYINAQQILRLGLGAVADRHRLTEDSLARLLRERVLKPEVKQRIQHLAAQLRTENGAAEAIRIIEQLQIPVHHPPPLHPSPLEIHQ